MKYLQFGFINFNFMCSIFLCFFAAIDMAFVCAVTVDQFALHLFNEHNIISFQFFSFAFLHLFSNCTIYDSTTVMSVDLRFRFSLR